MQLIKSLSLIFFALISLKAHAIDQMYNWNGLEFVTSGNVTHVHPASPQSTVLRGGWTLDISDVEPKATATHPIPYKNQSNALVTVKPQIDPKKVSASAASKIKDAAKSAGPNPYLAVASIGCAVFCDALIDWGLDKISISGDTVSVDVPTGEQHPVSTGFAYKPSFNSQSYPTPLAACQSYAGTPPQAYYFPDPAYYNSYADMCQIYISRIGGGFGYTADLGSPTRVPSDCPAGTPLVNGVCSPGAPPPSQSVPLETYMQSNYTGKGWDHHWAKMTAALAAQKINVFSDSMSTAIQGPALVPLSSNEQKTGVQLLPGTTTPAPAGHTGPTESGTQTTTTTTTAHNKFNPAPMASGSSGSPASGPSMETTQKTTTTTTITNNVTNITNIVNETTTEKDEAPEEAPTDTPFSDLPELYKQKYPDGLIGVLRTQTAAMKATPLFQLPMQLMGDLPQTGQCPSWQLDLSLASWASFGTYNVGADCEIWDFAGWVIVISACILARQLIFGG